MTIWFEAVLLTVGVILLRLAQRSLLQRRRDVAAMHDRTTGLLAADQWRELAEGELTGTARRCTRMGLLMIEVDQWRRFASDSSDVRDELIRAVGWAMRGQTRPDDLVCRLADARFVLVVADVGPTEVQRIAHRIRGSVAGLSVPIAEGLVTVDGISVSIGAAVYPDDGNCLDDLILTADVLLLAAQQDGPNQIRFTRVVARRDGLDSDC